MTARPMRSEGGKGKMARGSQAAALVDRALVDDLALLHDGRLGGRVAGEAHDGEADEIGGREGKNGARLTGGGARRPGPRGRPRAPPRRAPRWARCRRSP